MKKGRCQNVPAPSVERWQAVDAAAFRIDDERKGGVDAVPEQHFMGIQGPLRKACGTRSVENENRVIALNEGIGEKFVLWPLQPSIT